MRRTGTKMPLAGTRFRHQRRLQRQLGPPQAEESLAAEELLALHHQDQYAADESGNDLGEVVEKDEGERTLLGDPERGERQRPAGLEGTGVARRRNGGG